MLLGTLVYVNAGTQLAQIQSLGDIASPGLLASFAALGLFPWIARGIMNLIKRRRVYKGWTKPKSYDRNIVVIGAGAAGLVSSLIGATVKAKVTLVESHKMGGDCLNFGCVPSKALIKSAKVAEQMRHADRYGLAPADPEYHFKAVLARVHGAIATIEPNDSVERYTGLGVDVALGHARIVDPWTVEITPHQGKVYRLTTKSIIIASGARPFVPPLPGMADSGYLTSDSLWDIMAERDAPPARLTVLGGGPIGCELAQAFARLGSEVALVTRAERLLPREDADVAEQVRTSFRRQRISVHTEFAPLFFGPAAGAHECVFSTPRGQKRLAFDRVLLAVGRSANVEDLGLDALGVAVGPTGVIEVDDYLCTAIPTIYGCGDVVGPYQFTHMASHQAWYAAVNALFGRFRRFRVDYSVVPWATFTDPEVARVGLNEEQAKAQNIAYDISRYELADLDRAIADGEAHGFIKVLTQPGRDRILGATIVGYHAAELIQEFVLAMKHGLGLGKLLGTIHIYPTLGEANKFVAGEWRKARKPEALLNWVERYHQWNRS
jgi:pyruvate/2-oxoglutarate dehydrogenase complex dihydrolipoamide dehydrogenase (E3) component